MSLARRAGPWITAASLSLAALALGAAPASAQEVVGDVAPPALAAPVVTPAVTPDGPADAPLGTPSVSGPTMRHAVAGVRQLDVARAVQAQDVDRRRSRDVVLMIVGGAGIVVGSIVGDEAGTIITIAGAVMLLYGLYHFLD
jgi:hypothetical protein